MRSRSVTVAVTVSALAAAGAGYAHFRAHQLRTDAGWLLERSSAQADEYATTLDSKVAEDQLATFDQRRAVLEHAELWQRYELLSILLTVVGGFSSYVLYLFRRLREQLVEAGGHLEEPSGART
jgi:hypothetical protein